ncbi:MAG: VWA domain-containing protein, partial [Actinobacteria bacterium]|nr:VWA domain-containing protein [Actinomycetota bacterium]
MRLQRPVLLTLLAGLAMTAHSAVSARGGQPPQARPPVFRSAVTLVPVDVRVVDGSGKPVTDLKQEEFTIVEDGTRQEIRHFALQTFTPAEPVPGAALALRRDAVSFEPQTNRIFLIVLGRGKLQEPSKAVDALLRFVRERLLPQDQVAVFAYNRATTFTTDHQMVARLLERFKT